jgi:hypothetical protein
MLRAISEEANERSSVINSSNNFWNNLPMSIKHIIDRLDEIEQNTPTIKKYIVESVYNAPEMTKHWRKLDEGFAKGYSRYLNEVALTPDQIQNIFKQAGGTAGEAPKDPSKLAGLVDKILPTGQAANLEKTLPEPDAGPVQGFEQKAAAAVQNIQGADSATKQSLMQWIKQGVAKPESQQLILAAVGAGLGTILSKVGPIISMIPGAGPFVAAITGALIAGAISVASAKLQGKDWKTAFKGAIKPALMGGAAAVVGNLAATAIGTGLGAMTGGQDQAAAPLPGASLGVGKELPDGEVISALDSSNPNSGVTIQRPDGSTYTVSRDTAQAMTGQTGISNQANMTGPVSMGAASDPQAGVSDSGGSGAKTNTDKSLMRLKGYDPDAPNEVKAWDKITAGNKDLNTIPNIDSGFSGAQAGGPKPTIGQNFDPGSAPIGANGQPMRQVPMDAPAVTPSTPSDGSYQQAAPIGANGQPMQQVPMDAPPPKGAGMDPEYLAKIARGEGGRALISQDAAKAAIAWQAQNGGQVIPPPAPSSNVTLPGGLSQYYKDNPGIRENAIDQQATLRGWLKKDQQGITINSVQLTPMFVEGIMDFFKGKGKEAAPAAAGSGVTPDALNKAWADAGSPTDSDEVSKVLQSAGVPAETVTKIFTDLKIPAPGASPEAPKDPAATPTAADGETPPAPAGEKPADASAPDATTPPDELADIKKNAGLPTTPPPTDATAPASTTGSVDPATSAAVEPPPTPQAEKQSKVGVGQINKVIPTLRVRDLTSVQKTVDNTLAKRQSTKQPTAEGKYVGVYSNFLGRDI